LGLSPRLFCAAAAAACKAPDDWECGVGLDGTAAFASEAYLVALMSLRTDFRLLTRGEDIGGEAVWRFKFSSMHF